jgi:hypothetical protein
LRYIKLIFSTHDKKKNIFNKHWSGIRAVVVVLRLLLIQKIEQWNSIMDPTFTKRAESFDNVKSGPVETLVNRQKAFLATRVSDDNVMPQ